MNLIVSSLHGSTVKRRGHTTKANCPPGWFQMAIPARQTAGWRIRQGRESSAAKHQPCSQICPPAQARSDVGRSEKKERTVRAPLARKLHPRARQLFPLIASPFPALPTTPSPSAEEYAGGDSASADERGTRRYGPDGEGSKDCTGGGALCSNAMSCAVAATVSAVKFH